VYVPDDAALPLFRKAGAICGELTGEVVCVTPDGAEPLRALLAASPR